MPLTPASFLAGSLLSMLLPILLLITLAFLIYQAIQHLPGGDASQARRATEAEHAPPSAAAPSTLAQPTGDPPVREV